MDSRPLGTRSKFIELDLRCAIEAPQQDEAREEASGAWKDRSVNLEIGVTAVVPKRFISCSLANMQYLILLLLHDFPSQKISMEPAQGMCTISLKKDERGTCAGHGHR